jgi:hypothetical protein
MVNMSSLTGKVAIVTGASKGIGSLSVDAGQSRLMKQNGRNKQPKAKVIREKRPASRPAKRSPMVPLPAAWER